MLVDTELLKKEFDYRERELLRDGQPVFWNTSDIKALIDNVAKGAQSGEHPT